MPKIHINKQHHYVTLKVTFDDKRCYNLTISHSGTRGTSSAPASLPAEDKSIFNRVFKAFDAATWTDKIPITGNVGERVDKLAEIARGCHTSAILAERFELAIGATPKVAGKEVTVARLAKELAAKTCGPKVVTRPIEVITVPAGMNPVMAIAAIPLPNEGSGKFIQRCWMIGHNDLDALVAKVLKHYPGRTTKRSDIAYNVNLLRQAHGADNVPAWPKKG